jgi:hypothetical protein
MILIIFSHRKSRFEITSELVASDPLQLSAESRVVRFAVRSEHEDASNLTRMRQKEDV